MPLFEYQCDTCGKITELLVNAGEKEDPACEHCEAKKLTKRFSRISVSSGGADGDHGCTSCGDMHDSGDFPSCAGSGTCGL